MHCVPMRARHVSTAQHPSMHNLPGQSAVAASIQHKMERPIDTEAKRGPTGRVQVASSVPYLVLDDPWHWYHDLAATSLESC